MSINPRDYQLDVIEAAKKHFATELRGQLILPCGTGKTLVSLWIKEALVSTFTIFCVPSLALMRQTRDEWQLNFSDAYTSYFVCSESDIDTSHDDLVIDIKDFGANVSTNINDITEFINKNNSKLVIFCTYHSLPELAKALRLTNRVTDLIICDEAHKTTGKDCAAFSMVHNNQMLPAKYRLYMTATPKIYSKFNIKDKDNEIYLNHMGNKEVFGSVIYEMSFGKAIELDILVDYKLIIIGIADKDLEKAIKSGSITEDGATAEVKAHHYALNKAMKDYNLRHIITFHSRVNTAKEFAAKHREMYSENYCKAITGIDTSKIREKYVSEFISSKSGVLSNARCLTEGVDIPDIDAVYFCDPKNSLVDIVQAVGRVLRKPRNKSYKTTGYVILPLYYSNIDNIDIINTTDNFSQIINTLRLMSSYDERLNAEIIDSWASNIERHSNKAVATDQKIIFKNFDNLIEYNITTQVYSLSIVQWIQNFTHYKKWVEKYNTEPSENEKDNVEYQIARWASKQRTRFNEGLLSSNKIEKLNSINFRFHAVKLPDWEERFANYKIWLEKYNKEPSKNKNDNVESKLAKWAATQRLSYKSKLLCPDRIEKLNSINFRFSAVKLPDWEEQFANYKIWLEKYKAAPSRNQKKDNTECQLARWVERQMSLFKKGQLNLDRIEKLKKLTLDFKIVR